MHHAVVKRQPSSEISLCAGIFILRLHNFLLTLFLLLLLCVAINENHTLWLLLLWPLFFGGATDIAAQTCRSFFCTIFHAFVTQIPR